MFELGEISRWMTCRWFSGRVMIILPCEECISLQRDHKKPKTHQKCVISEQNKKQKKSDTFVPFTKWKLRRLFKSLEHKQKSVHHSNAETIVILQKLTKNPQKNKKKILKSFLSLVLQDYFFFINVNAFCFLHPKLLFSPPPPSRWRVRWSATVGPVARPAGWTPHAVVVAQVPGLAIPSVSAVAISCLISQRIRRCEASFSAVTVQMKWMQNWFSFVDKKARSREVDWTLMDLDFKPDFPGHLPVLCYVSSTQHCSCICNGNTCRSSNNRPFSSLCIGRPFCELKMNTERWSKCSAMKIKWYHKEKILATTLLKLQLKLSLYLSCTSVSWLLIADKKLNFFCLIS